jgi:hypothetical protein
MEESLLCMCKFLHIIRVKALILLILNDLILALQVQYIAQNVFAF